LGEDKERMNALTAGVLEEILAGLIMVINNKKRIL
jgi:hypothetical protein